MVIDKFAFVACLAHNQMTPIPGDTGSSNLLCTQLRTDRINWISASINHCGSIANNWNFYLLVRII